MAQLPRVRSEMTQKPFANCPFYTILGRGRARVMRYLGLFVYLQTRCFQLEMATPLETFTFLNAMTQMVA